MLLDTRFYTYLMGGLINYLISFIDLVSLETEKLTNNNNTRVLTSIRMRLITYPDHRVNRHVTITF